MIDVIYILSGVVAFFAITIIYLLKKEEKNSKKN